MSKRSILFVTTQLPYPPKSGGKIKSWHYLKDLQKKYQIGLASLLKDDDSSYIEEFQGLIDFKDFYTRPLQVNRNIISLFKSYIGFPCLNVFRNYNKEFKEKVAALAKDYDAILIDHYEVFQYVPEDYKGKVILHTHNAEFEIWKRMENLSSNPLIKIALRIEAKRVLSYEKKIISRSDLVYATPSDIECYQEVGIQTDKIKVTYHLGNDELLDLPLTDFNATEKAMIFMGTLSWEPNIDGLLWFIEEVYPLILKKHADLKFYILGREADDRLRIAADPFPSIELCGFVDDIGEYLKKCRVFLAPLRFGSGMKVKVLEGMYSGVPIVTTKVGAEGIEVEDQKELLIADDAKSYAEKCIQLLEEKDLWNQVRENGRKKAAEKYTWQPLFKMMDEDLLKTFD